MELKELAKMTVVKLREEAHKFEDVKDALGMSKEQLIELLCKKYNIKRKQAVPTGIGRRALKGRIRELRRKKAEVLAAGDGKSIRRYRRRLKSLRRRLHKVIARAARSRTATSEKAAEAGPATPAE